MRYKYNTIERSLNYSEQFNFKGKVINSVTKTPISGARIITPSPIRTDKKFHSLHYAGSNSKNDSYTKTDGSFTAKGAVGQVITFTHPDYFPARFKYKGKYNNTIELTPLTARIDETLVTDPYIKTEQLDEVIVTANSKKINYKMIGFGLLGLIILKKIFSKKTKKVKL